MQILTWSCLRFDELSPAQLYVILKLRTEVFVLEQQCLYQDLDDYDQGALHLMGMHDNSLLCYARLLPPEIKYNEPSIGRVICAFSQRGNGYGRVLIQNSLDHCELHWPGQGIRISAQERLEKLYQEFGFEPDSEPYLEDGLPHIEMLRKREGR